MYNYKSLANAKENPLQRRVMLTEEGAKILSDSYYILFQHYDTKETRQVMIEDDDPVTVTHAVMDNTLDGYVVPELAGMKFGEEEKDFPLTYMFSNLSVTLDELESKVVYIAGQVVWRIHGVNNISCKMAMRDVQDYIFFYKLDEDFGLLAEVADTLEYYTY